MPGDAAGVAISNGDRRLAVTTLAWIDRCAFRPEYRAADRNSANNAEITRRIIDRDLHEISELRLSNLLQFCFSGAGLLQPELPGEISATRDFRDSHAGLCRGAGSVSAAFVLFLPADRAARARGATSCSAYRGWPRRIGRAQANRQRSCHAASQRREVIYRSAVSHLDRGALHLEDRDELSCCAPTAAHRASIGTGIVPGELLASTEISFARPSVSRSVGTSCSA